MSEQLEQGGRSADGRFATGNAGGPGNPFAKQTARMRAEALAELSSDEIRQLIRRLFVNAMRGDVASAKLVLAYTIGKPERVADAGPLGEGEPALPVVGTADPVAGSARSDEPSGDKPEAKTPFVDGASPAKPEASRPHVSVRDTIASWPPEMVQGLAKLINPRPPKGR